MLSLLYQLQWELEVHKSQLLCNKSHHTISSTHSCEVFVLPQIAILVTGRTHLSITRQVFWTALTFILVFPNINIPTLTFHCGRRTFWSVFWWMNEFRNNGNLKWNCSRKQNQNSWLDIKPMNLWKAKTWNEKSTSNDRWLVGFCSTWNWSGSNALYRNTTPCILEGSYWDNNPF